MTYFGEVVRHPDIILRSSFSRPAGLFSKMETIAWTLSYFCFTSDTVYEHYIATMLS